MPGASKPPPVELHRPHQGRGHEHGRGFLIRLALLLLVGFAALAEWLGLEVILGLIGGRSVAAAGLLQATSLAFIVAAVQIGTDLGLVGRSVGAALVAVALLSVLLFPLGALALLTQDSERNLAGLDEGTTE